MKRKSLHVHSSQDLAIATGGAYDSNVQHSESYSLNGKSVTREEYEAAVANFEQYTELVDVPTPDL